MASALQSLLVGLALAAGVAAQNLPPEAMLGLLPGQAGVPDTFARQRCLDLPVKPPEDRLAGPHGGSLLSTRCEVESYRALEAAPTGWNVAHYRWTSAFAEGDTVTEEESVLFEASQSEQVRPVWHGRFETGRYAVLRSITPEIAAASEGATLLSVMSCVNGTGGCGQEFLQRYPDGRWTPVRQDWFDQLPQSFRGRIRHGVRIDPRTLRGEAGFYGDGDPNCCPSELLGLELKLHGDALILIRQAVVREHEVSRGQEFRTEVEPGVEIVLRPTGTGWIIGVAPKTKCAE